MELVSGVWGHRLREVPRRRLCCFQCLHSIGFSVPVPATSRSGSHGADTEVIKTTAKQDGVL